MRNSLRIILAVGALLLAAPVSNAFAGEDKNFFDNVVDLFRPIFMEWHRSPVSIHTGDPVFGIAAAPVTPDQAKRWKLHHRYGLLVEGVVANTPAHKMGVVKGDIVLTLDNRPLASLQDLHDAVLASNDEFSTATVWRNGTEAVLELHAVRYLVHN